jgi:hypothetical protein
MSIELGENSMGLILSRDLPGFMAAVCRKSDKRVINRSAKTHARCEQMIGLARAAGNRPIAGHDGKPVIDITVKFVPPKWRDTTIRLKAFYYQLAIEMIAAEGGGTSRILTFNLSPSFTRNALQKGGLKFIRHRIAQKLNLTTDAQPEFWFVLEAATNETLHEKFRQRGTRSQLNCRTGRPHIHGSILVAADETTVRAALRAANGKADITFRRNETRIQPTEERKGGGRGWADYATKHLGFTRLFVPGTPLITSTNRITNRAKDLYEADRQAVIRAHRIRGD